jgi:hypothetical protein
MISHELIERLDRNLFYSIKSCPTKKVDFGSTKNGDLTCVNYLENPHIPMHEGNPKIISKYWDSGGRIPITIWDSQVLICVRYS